MIERFPTPGSIASIGREDFTEQVWPLIGRKVSKARVVNDIYETACASMALPIDEDSTAVTMFRMVAQARTPLSMHIFPAGMPEEPGKH